MCWGGGCKVCWGVVVGCPGEMVVGCLEEGVVVGCPGGGGGRVAVACAGGGGGRGGVVRCAGDTTTTCATATLVYTCIQVC